MKRLLLVLTLGVVFGCSDSKTPNDSMQNKKKNSIVKENNFCVCTKEYMPVCGEDGVTYGNKCEANCNKVKFTEGPCK